MLEAEKKKLVYSVNNKSCSPWIRIWMGLVFLWAKYNDEEEAVSFVRLSFQPSIRSVLFMLDGIHRLEAVAPGCDHSYV